MHDTPRKGNYFPQLDMMALLHSQLDFPWVLDHEDSYRLQISTSHSIKLQAQGSKMLATALNPMKFSN